VVKNYTTYATYYRLVKAVEDDPNLPKKKAARALAKFMSLHPHNIEQKTEVIVEHFRRKVRSHLGGGAKANPFDKFQLGLRQLIEELMVQSMADNDKIVTRYMDDKEFGSAAFAVLSKAIYDSIPASDAVSDGG